MAKQSRTPHSSNFSPLLHANLPPHSVSPAWAKKKDQQNQEIFLVEGGGECQWWTLPGKLANSYQTERPWWFRRA